MPKITEYKRKHNREYAKRRRVYLKELINRYKTRYGCKRCGYKEYSFCLDLHHRNPSEKDFKIAGQSGMTGFRKIKEEIRKCDILCAICHRIEHVGL